MKKYKQANNRKEKIIRLGQQQMLKNQIHNVSYPRLFLASLQLVDWKLWLFQFILIVFSLFLLGSNIGPSWEDILRGLTGLLLFSLIFFMDELFKSFTYNMWELEQTLKYDLRQHITMKMLAFGIFDGGLIILIALLGGQVFPISFFQLTLFLFVPFNSLCILLFLLFTLIRRQISKIMLWGSGSLLMIVIFILLSNPNVYALPLKNWLLAGIITLVILFLFVRKILKQAISGGTL